MGKVLRPSEGRMTAGQEAVEAYKSALRAEIEKQNKDKEFPQMLWTISEILNLIDNVTPKQWTPRKQNQKLRKLFVQKVSKQKLY